jgi:hypothetical protein
MPGGWLSVGQTVAENRLLQLIRSIASKVGRIETPMGRIETSKGFWSREIGRCREGFDAMPTFRRVGQIFCLKANALNVLPMPSWGVLLSGHLNDLNPSLSPGIRFAMVKV